jgi:hypothetical protein
MADVTGVPSPTVQLTANKAVVECFTASGSAARGLVAVVALGEPLQERNDGLHRVRQPPARLRR